MQVATDPIRSTGFVAGVRTRLEDLGSATWWRAALAFLSGLMTFLVTTGGLIILIPWVQSAIIAGIVVGLTSPKIKTSALVGAMVGLLGAVYGPENFYNELFNFTPVPPDLSLVVVIGAIVVCGAVAAGVTLLRDRYEGSTAALVGVAILMLIVNLWFTPITLNAVSSTKAGDVPLSAFNDQLEGTIDDALLNTDGALFLYTLIEMEEGGRGFYDAYSTVLTVARGGTSSVADYRTPAVWWLWSMLPNRQSIVIAWLVLATLAVLAAVSPGITTVKAPLVIPGVAALTAYLANFSFNIELLRQDHWAAAVGVIAFAAYGISVRSAKWRAWTVAAVALTVLSVFTREVMAFLLIAGFISAFFGDRSQRRFRLIAWIVGIIVFAALFGAHAMTAQPYINAPVADVPRAGYGDVSFMLLAFDYATSFLGRHGMLPMFLGVMGIAGAFLIRDSRVRVYALIATLGPLAAFLVLGNNAYSGVPGGERISQNYWGVAVVPLLYAAIPFAFSILPQSLAAASPEGAGSAPAESPAEDVAHAEVESTGEDEG